MTAPLGDDFLNSWEVRVDTCYGAAARILEHVTEQFLRGELDELTAETAVTLAEAWRDLGMQWLERQDHELMLAESWPEDDAEETEADEERQESHS